MKIRVRYFASLREALGADENIDMPEAGTVAELRNLLLALGGRHAEVLARGRAVRTALNQTLCDEATALSEGDEVAFFPPVTGG
ncbi:MAG: molybdopterin converting factor subunit 1 [Rubrivivax sp.]|nr:molybdopterin converting factor subunit 1 [Rubrivivax sp.]MDP3221550.1 molybdopterin converting factor subunit 1 [Rubrivivax sp.]MDP3613762.1 molybdopterin converting factor subunit 1 [Rubrivivax sp.]